MGEDQGQGHSRNQGKSGGKKKAKATAGAREQSLDLDEEGQQTASHKAKAGQNCDIERGTEQTRGILFRVQKRKGMILTYLEA